MMKWVMTVLVLFGVSGGAARAASEAERMAPGRMMPGEADLLSEYDIDIVVDAAVKAMGDAARDHYLPDGAENSKAIKRYTKDARKAALMDTSFKRELAQVCADLANAAAHAREEAMLPGRRLALPSGLKPVPLGVSSKTVTTDGGVTTVFTNTMPCIQAAATALYTATLKQFPETASNSAAKEVYGNQFASIMTGNRLFNHVLADVCSKLVGFAERSSEQNRKK